MPKPTATRSDVLDYLTLGFVPDSTLALEYLTHLSEQVEAAIHSDPGIAQRKPESILASILSRELESRSATEVSLPLTGGLDSRGLLGACLEVLPANRIHCYTFGTDELDDCIVASRVCRRLGIRWSRVDPLQIEWNLDHVVDVAMNIWRTSRCYVEAYGVGFESLVRAMSDDAPIVSGFLGDMISGAHLRGGDQRRGQEVHTAHRFLNANSTELRAYDNIDPLVDHFTHLLRKADTCFPNLPGRTPYDLLDLGFRQRQRIAALAKHIFPSCITPYEDPQWIAYWLQRNFWERVYQKTYKRWLGAAYPEIFEELHTMPLGKRIRRKIASFESLRKLWIAPVTKKMRKRVKTHVPVELRERGDPRASPSLQQMIRTCAQSFDQRKILPAYSATDEFDANMQTPTGASWARLRWMVSAEVHIRAGNLEG